MTSTARVEANRRNAKRSTGPRTEPGKARSRWNSLRHGLRAEHAVIPTESKAEFAAHLRAWVGDWRPPTQARLLLVERAATASWRLRRCVRVESARLATRVYEAYGRWDGSQDRIVGDAVLRLHQGPGEAVDVLESCRAGLVRLIGIWETIADGLAEPGGWVGDFRHHRDFVDLLAAGCDDDEELDEDADASRRLLLRDNRSIGGPLGSEPLDDERAEHYRAKFAAIARGCLDHYAEMLESMPEDTPARRRYAEVEATTPRPEDAALLRYEAHFDRQARACIAQLARLEQTGADLVGDDREPVGLSVEDTGGPEPAGATRTSSETPSEAKAEPPGTTGGLRPTGAIEGEPRLEVVGGQGTCKTSEAGAPSKPNPVAMEDAPAPSEPNGPAPKRASRRDRRARTWPVEPAGDAQDGR